MLLPIITTSTASCVQQGLGPVLCPIGTEQRDKAVICVGTSACAEIAPVVYVPQKQLEQVWEQEVQQAGIWECTNAPRGGVQCKQVDNLKPKTKAKVAPKH